MDVTRLLIAAAAGGAVLFVWNAIAWMALQYHNSDFKRVPQREIVEDALSRAGLSAGMYMLPHGADFPQGMKDPGLEARWKKGPNATIVVAAPGPCMTGLTFLRGYLLCFFEALGAAILFRVAWERLGTLPRSVGFGAGLGLLIHGVPHLQQSNWATFPWIHSIKSAIDGLVGMALVGLLFHFIGV